MSSSSARPSRVLHFGSFDLDLTSGELCKFGTRVRLQEQPFQVLTMLLERPSEVVTREELRQRLWPADTFVDFNHGLNNAVNRLREVLGDSADTPKFIETIPRRGYRFIVPVEQAGAAQVKLVQSPSAPRVATTDGEDLPTGEIPRSSSPDAVIRREPGTLRFSSSRQSRIFVVAAIAMILVLIVASLGALLVRTPSRAPHIRALAVLPLENVSGDATQEYFADGMTDSLITNLAGLRSVRVISRTSAMHYKSSHQALPDIARELNVDAVVEGTVARLGDRVRINAQLIDARTDSHLWADAYERDVHDIMALQSELAADIATHVASRVDSQRQQRSNKKVDPKAYEAYLRGIHLASERFKTNDKAREYFNESLRIDPSNNDAIVALAETYILDDPAAARLLASNALQRDETLGEAHAIVASVEFLHDWDFTSAESEFQRALDFAPNSSLVRDLDGLFLAQTGRLQEAEAQLRAAELLDPLSADIHCDLGVVLYFAHRYEDAVAQLQGVLKQDPDYAYAHRILTHVYEVKGQVEPYASEFVKAAAWFEMTPEQAEHQAQQLRTSYATGGVQGFWRKRLEIELARGDKGNPIALARAYALLGDRDHAFAALEDAYRRHDDGLTMWLRIDPKLDNLRPDPRFQLLLKRVGFQY